MLYELFNIKQALSNHLVNDIIKLIQIKYYDLIQLKLNDVLVILDNWVEYNTIDNKYYISGWMCRNYFRAGGRICHNYKMYKSDTVSYITIEYKLVYSDPKCKRVKDTYGFVIKIDKFQEPMFDLIRSRLTNNTYFYTVKSGKNRIILLYKN
jgi:hypothetical protein